jgi:hypothetical protein
MSETGLYSADITQLRQLGSLVDQILVGAAKSDDRSFQKACEDLEQVLSAASSQPPRDLQSLVFSDLLGDYVRSVGAKLFGLREDLRRHSIGAEASEMLEALARSLDQERAAATGRMQPMR